MSLGAFLRDELLSLWRSVVSRPYGRRFVEAGEGRGYEVFSQAAEQYTHLSQSIDVSLQAMFILPSSQQTNPPASGAQRATVELLALRWNVDVSRAYVITRDVVFEEETTDMGPDGPIVVLTERRYRPTAATVFGPGEAGPKTIQCEAVRSGYGANRAGIGCIKRFVQRGSNLANDGASIVPGTTSHALVARPDPDVPIADHVGRYVLLVSGANAGQIRRVVGYAGPDANEVPPHGGKLFLAPTAQWTSLTPSNTFQVGEPAMTTSGAEVTVWYSGPDRVVFDVVSGTPIVGDEISGLFTGATANLDLEEQSHLLVAETGSVSWKILDWETEVGVQVTNAAQPSGGTSAMLDEVGWERKVYRAPGEVDDVYRKRVATPADTISPNAIRRAVNRVLTPFGRTATLHEVGLATFPGVYADQDAFDMDFDLRPADRFKLVMDYTEFRAFFVIEVPRLGLGDFSAAYDEGGLNAYDEAAADGYATQDAAVYQAIWHAVNEIKGGGVGFDLVLEPAT